MRSFFVFIAIVAIARAAILPVYSTGPNIWTTIRNAQPGDEVVVYAGDYRTNSLGSYYLLLNIVGTATQPIIIRTNPGDTVRILGDPAASQNALNIQGRYFVFKGFEIMYGSHGIRLQPNVEDAVFEGLNVHDTNDVGISANIGGAVYRNVTFRRNEVSHTGGTGECFYIGCNSNGCTFRDGLFEGNYCHHTLASEGVTQGDGIEVKSGSFNNIIRDNVIHDVNYPGIFVYDAATYGAPNIVERNIIWNAGENGIQITAGAVIKNNIIINSAGSGIAIQTNQGSPRDVSVLHNTVFTAASSCFYASWGTALNFKVINNAFYCEGGSAINIVSPNANAITRNNVVRGSVAGAGATQITGNGGSDFISTANRNFFPSGTSALRNAGDSANTLTDDFNGTPRVQVQATVGAYQYAASNPGWTVQPGFKPLPSGPSTTTGRSTTGRSTTGRSTTGRSTTGRSTPTTGSGSASTTGRSTTGSASGTPSTTGRSGSSSATTGFRRINVVVTISLPRAPSTVDLNVFVDEITDILGIPSSAISDITVDLDRSTSTQTFVRFTIWNEIGQNGQRIDPIAVAQNLRTLAETNSGAFQSTSMLAGLKFEDVEEPGASSSVDEKEFVGSMEFYIMIGALSGLIVIALTVIAVVAIRRRKIATFY